MRRFLFLAPALFLACSSSPSETEGPTDSGTDSSSIDSSIDSSTDTGVGTDSTVDSSEDTPPIDTGSKKDTGVDTGPPTTCPPTIPSSGDPCATSVPCEYGDPKCPDVCYCKGVFYCSPCSPPPPPPPPPPPFDAGVCPPATPTAGDPCVGPIGPCSFPDGTGCTTTCYCKSSWFCIADPCVDGGPPPPPPPTDGGTCLPCATPGDPCKSGEGCGVGGPGCCWSCACGVAGWECKKC